MKKIKGIKKACSDTKDLLLLTEWVELFYSLEERRVWAVYHNSIDLEWTEYRDSNIVRVCTTKKYMSQAEILASIKRNVLDRLYPQMEIRK